MEWQRVKQVLSEAAARESPAERAAYLDEVCRDDARLRAEVERLLLAHAQAGAFLEEPVSSPTETPRPEEVGEKIGSYKLLQQIGEGGCGVVYMAEQEEPIRRRVALKIIKLGMDTRSVIARFEAERQALALMDHPNIARVLDAGATETGRPYFVMELVRGIRITDYCDQNRLTPEQRLHLFVQVCQAIQHAHQKGVIHRDIKPSNILVTVNDGVPVPKVIDFGIAKATEGRLTDKTLFTAFEQFIGTPAYMSPEQAAMTSLDVDTRSDIYALGVLLFELLTGHTPFDQRKLVAAGLDEMRRIIRQEVPQRPSTRLSSLTIADQTTVARCRQSEPFQLIHLVRGDLDWIVMRCLEKDRTRRYETANSLAEDIERHLTDQPVTARPPSRVYLLRKLIQRNKATFAAGGLVALALVAGLGFSLWTLGKERAARQQTLEAKRQAQSEASKSRQVAQFLKDMLQGVGPSAAQGRDTTMLREILDLTAGRVGRDLEDHPEVEAELRMTLGEVYQALGRYPQAEAMYRQALSLRRALWGEMNTNVADTLDRLGGQLVTSQHESVESAALIRQAYMIRTNLLGPEHVQVAASLHHLGKIEANRIRLIEADDLFQRSLAMRRRLLGNEHLEVAESLTTLAEIRTYQTRQDEAEAYAREALAILSKVVPDHRASLAVASAQAVMGEILHRQGHPDEAVVLLRSAVATSKTLLGSHHPEYASRIFDLASVLTVRNQLPEAEAAVREALAVNRATVGDRHPNTIYCLELLGGILYLAGRYPESEAAYREAYPDGFGLIKALRAQGKLAEAASVMDRLTAKAREAVEAVRTQPPSETGVEARLGWVEVLWRQTRVAESTPPLIEALGMIAHFPASPTLVDRISFQAMRNAALEVWFARSEEHTALCRRLVSWATDQPQFAVKGRAAGMVNLRPVNDPQLQASALALARQAVEASPTNALLVWYRLNLGVAEYRVGHYSEAERILLVSEQDGPTIWHPDARTCTSQYFRAMMLFQQGQTEAAHRLFLEAEAKTPPLPDAVHWTLAEGADYDDLMLWLAYKEAQALLNASPN